jgi:hypothetical protein
VGQAGSIPVGVDRNDPYRHAGAEPGQRRPRRLRREPVDAVDADERAERHYADNVAVDHVVDAVRRRERGPGRGIVLVQGVGHAVHLLSPQVPPERAKRRAAAGPPRGRRMAG